MCENSAYKEQGFSNEKGRAGFLTNSVVAPPYPRFPFQQFQLPAVNCGLKILNGKFQK